MPISFFGPGLTLTPADITAAAVSLGCLREAIMAVLTVETGGAGGFLADGTGRPRILFEAKKFSDATAHRFDETHPLISSSVQNWKLYQGGAAEYDRLDAALTLDPAAALASTSWGLFQVLGANAVSLGYDSVAAFVALMISGEAAQLDAFVRFVRVNHLADELSSLDWAGFARGYNGPAYAANQYDTKLGMAFRTAAGLVPPAGVFFLGSTGANVRQIQLRLIAAGYPPGMVDGIYGRATELAVKRFQSMMGLVVDGIAGSNTLRTLGVTLR